MMKAQRIGVLLAGIGIILGIAVTVKAQEESRSSGTIQFQSIEAAVGAWSEDILLLQKRVSGISVEAFDPENYS